MKTSRQLQKEQTRERILCAASELFRRNGFAATGVDAVMAEAGLTAGGFYSHFKSKEDLLSKVVEHSLSDVWSRFSVPNAAKKSPRERLGHALDIYLSEKHRDHPELGCPLVAIAAELDRKHLPSARVISDYIERWLTLLIEAGNTRAQAMQKMSAVVGALLISRLVQPEKLSGEILHTVASELRKKT